MVASGTLSYLGPFTAEYRTRIADSWVQARTHPMDEAWGSRGHCLMASIFWASGCSGGSLLSVPSVVPSNASSITCTSVFLKYHSLRWAWLFGKNDLLGWWREQPRYRSKREFACSLD